MKHPGLQNGSPTPVPSANRSSWELRANVEVLGLPPPGQGSARPAWMKPGGAEGAPTGWDPRPSFQDRSEPRAERVERARGRVLGHRSLPLRPRPPRTLMEG